MRQRNRLLEENADPLWLNALEAEMAAHAAALHFARADAVAHLAAMIEAGAPDPAFPAAGVSLTPLFDDRHEPASSPDLEAELRSLWAGTRTLDRAAGRTVTGPHRVDFDVHYAQKEMPAALGSTGEQKALLVGLILAHARLVAARTGITPFLLLDEIAAHLDPDRRAALFATLDALGTQCLMTGTDPMLFDALGDGAQRVTVRDGRLNA
jgi:DNA replication and repair protein RecF